MLQNDILARNEKMWRQERIADNIDMFYLHHAYKQDMIAWLLNNITISNSCVCRI